MRNHRSMGLVICILVMGMSCSRVSTIGAEMQKPMLADQSRVWGSFILVDRDLAYSWGYGLGTPFKVTSQFPGEIDPGFYVGQLHAAYQNLPFPIRFDPGNHHWSAVFCNSGTAMLLDENGALWALPFQPDHQPGQVIASLITIPFPAGVSGWKSASIDLGAGYFVSREGGLYALASVWTNAPVLFPANSSKTNWVSVVTTRFESLALDTDGKLFGWGQNFLYRQLGPTVTDWRLTEPTLLHSPPGGGRWQIVRLGDQHSAGLTDDGRLFTWGTNYRGQLGGSEPYTLGIVQPPLPDGVNRWRNVWCGTDFTLAQGDNGILYEWGSGIYDSDGSSEIRSYPPPTDSGGWVQATAGEYHRMALTGDGRLFAWGSNFVGQLGRGRRGREQTFINFYQEYGSRAEYEPVEVNLPIAMEGNRAPSARLLAPLHGSEFGYPHPLQLVAQAVDPEGSLAKVEFVIDGSPTLAAHLDTNGLYVADWPDPPQGEYAIKVHAVDALGAEGWSEDNWLALLPYVSIEPGHAVGREPGYHDPGEPISFIIRRTGPTDQPLKIDLSVDTYASTATPDADFVWPYQWVPVTFPTGVSSVEFPVVIKPDRVAEADETLSVCITVARAAPGTNVCASVTIRDTPDDPRRLNIPPSIELGLPGDGAEFIKTSEIPVFCDYSDEDGIVVGLDWYSETNLISLTSNPSTWFGWFDPKPGVHAIRAKATDNEGGVTWSRSMTITILDRTNDPAPTVVSFTTLDPIAIRGTDDTAAIKIVRSGNAYGQLTIRHQVTGAVTGTDFSEDGEWINFFGGQVASVLRVHALANANAPAAQAVEFRVVGPPPGYGGFYEPTGKEPSPVATIYLVQPSASGTGNTTGQLTPVVFDLRRENYPHAWLHILSNPGSAMLLEFSEDGTRWSPFLQLEDSSGDDVLPLNTWGADHMELFRAAPARSGW